MEPAPNEGDSFTVLIPPTTYKVKGNLFSSYSSGICSKCLINPGIKHPYYIILFDASGFGSS